MAGRRQKVNIDELMLLFLAARLRIHGEFILTVNKLKKETEIDSYVSRLKQHHGQTIASPLTDSDLMRSFDNCLLYLCKQGHRALAEYVDQRIKNQNAERSAQYIKLLIDEYKYKIESSARERSERILYGIKRGIGVAWLIYLSCKLYQILVSYPLEATKTTGYMTGLLYQQLYSIIGDLHPVKQHVYWFILFLFISYLLKSAIALVIWVTGEDDYAFGTYKSEWEAMSLFLWLCAVECIVFGLFFGLHGWWWGIKTFFFLELPSLIGYFFLMK